MTVLRLRRRRHLMRPPHHGLAPRRVEHAQDVVFRNLSQRRGLRRRRVGEGAPAFVDGGRRRRRRGCGCRPEARKVSIHGRSLDGWCLCEVREPAVAVSRRNCRGGEVAEAVARGRRAESVEDGARRWRGDVEHIEQSFVRGRGRCCVRHRCWNYELCRCQRLSHRRGAVAVPIPGNRTRGVSVREFFSFVFFANELLHHGQIRAHRFRRPWQVRFPKQVRPVVSHALQFHDLHLAPPVKLRGSHEGNVHPETAVDAAAVRAHEDAEVHTGPPRKPHRAVRAHQVLGALQTQV